MPGRPLNLSKTGFMTHLFAEKSLKDFSCQCAYLAQNLAHKLLSSHFIQLFQSNSLHAIRLNFFSVYIAATTARAGDCIGEGREECYRDQDEEQGISGGISHVSL